MRVHCKGYLTFRELIGQRFLELGDNEVTLENFLELLCVQAGPELRDALYDPATGELYEHITVLLNGRHYRHLPERLDTPLKEGDEVAIFPPIAGGL
jgi:sulfur-carrier protein